MTLPNITTFNTTAVPANVRVLKAKSCDPRAALSVMLVSLLVNISSSLRDIN